jgi:hypothetical protein
MSFDVIGTLIAKPLTICARAHSPPQRQSNLGDRAACACVVRPNFCSSQSVTGRHG